MVRRSDHCLPSDSDKFTIKLHSLPSKFLSSSSCLLAFLLPARSPPFPPRWPPVTAPPRRGSFFSVDTWELLRWSLGILTGDNHNSRYTRATVSLRPPVLSLPVPPLSARLSSTSSLSSTLRPFAPRACAYVCLCLPLSLGLLSLLLRRVVLAPASPRGPIILSRRPRLFRNCFQAFLLLLRLPLLRATSRASRYPRYFTGVSLSFSVFPAFSASSSIPLYRSPPSGAPLRYLFLDLCRTYLPTFPPVAPLSFSKWAPEFMRRN